MKRLIIGCGFVGFPLAKLWNEAGDTVYATTRNPQRQVDFEALGLNPVLADITDTTTLHSLNELEFDTVVVAVGMDRSRYSSVHHVYVDGLKNVLSNLYERIGHIIYISSTGVYGNFDGDWVDESSPTDPQREGGRACLAAEQTLTESSFGDRATILRMAGLYGGTRVPTRGTIESKQWDKLSASGYLNLIHVDDAVTAICAIAQQRLLQETFLVSDSNPTLRREYYQHIADQFGLGQIPWDENAIADPQSRSSSSKRISNRKLLQATGLTLKHPDFRSGLKDSF